MRGPSAPAAGGRAFWGASARKRPILLGCVRFDSPGILAVKLGGKTYCNHENGSLGYWGEIFEGPSARRGVQAASRRRSRGRQEPRRDCSADSGKLGRKSRAIRRIFCRPLRSLWTAEGEDFRGKFVPFRNCWWNFLKNWTREPAAAPAQFRLYVADLSAFTTGRCGFGGAALARKKWGGCGRQLRSLIAGS